jgi:hypothetical protein
LGRRCRAVNDSIPLPQTCFHTLHRDVHHTTWLAILESLLLSMADTYAAWHAQVAAGIAHLWFARVPFRIASLQILAGFRRS